MEILIVENSVALLAQQATVVEWFREISNFGVLAILLFFMCWGIVVGFKFLAHKLFGDPDPSRQFKGGLVVRWTEGQLSMMDEIRDAVREIRDGAKKQLEASEQFSDKLAHIVQSVGEVKQIVLKADSVTFVPERKVRSGRTQLKDGEEHDPNSGR